MDMKKSMNKLKNGDVIGEDGERMEPRQTSKFEIKGDVVYFDKRFVSKPILRYCGQVTGTNVVSL